MEEEKGIRRQFQKIGQNPPTLGGEHWRRRKGLGGNLRKLVKIKGFKQDASITIRTKWVRTDMQLKMWIKRLTVKPIECVCVGSDQIRNSYF